MKRCDICLIRLGEYDQWEEIDYNNGQIVEDWKGMSVEDRVEALTGNKYAKKKHINRKEFPFKGQVMRKMYIEEYDKSLVVILEPEKVCKRCLNKYKLFNEEVV